MAYENHIFISYAHGDVWTQWVRDKFVPRLQSYLQLEIGRLDVFVDDQVQTGSWWESVLKQKVATSRLMLALISADYFQRDWCRREMALMLQREKELKLIGNGENYGFLIPVRLGDGNCYPDIVGRVQAIDFEDFADPDLTPGTDRASRFNQELRRLAKTIAQTLPRVPDSHDSWHAFNGDEFYSQLHAKPLLAPLPSRLIV